MWSSKKIRWKESTESVFGRMCRYEMYLLSIWTPWLFISYPGTIKINWFSLIIIQHCSFSSFFLFFKSVCLIKYLLIICIFLLFFSFGLFGLFLNYMECNVAYELPLNWLAFFPINVFNNNRVSTCLSSLQILFFLSSLFFAFFIVYINVRYTMKILF